MRLAIEALGVEPHGVGHAKPTILPSLRTIGRCCERPWNAVAERVPATVGRQAEALTNDNHQLVTKNESHLAVPRVGVMRITSACGSGEWARAGGGGLLSTVSWAGSTRGAEPLLTYRSSARIEAS